MNDLIDGKVPDMLPPGEALEPDPLADGAGQTTRPSRRAVEGVFSGGDVVTGAATAIEAIAAGRKAAYAIDTYVRERRRPAGAARSSSAARTSSPRSAEGPAVAGETKRERHMPMLPAEERVKSFAEVELGYSART